MAIVVGLAIGFAVREAMKPESAVVRSIVPTTVLPDKRFNRLSGAVDLLEKGLDGRRRTLQEAAEHRSAVLDLPPRDLKRLFERIKDEAPPDYETLEALFSAWGESAPQEALVALEGLPYRSRIVAKRALLSSWVLSDTEGAFKFVQSGVSREQVDFFPAEKDAGLWRMLAYADPHRALKRAATIGDSARRRKIETDIVAQMSYEDPRSALAWLAENSEGEEQEFAMGRAIAGWASTEPNEALHYLSGLDEDLASGKIYERFGGALVHDAGIAQGMLEDVPEAHRDRFWGGFLENYASRDPARAAEMSTMLTSGEARRGAFFQIASQWSFKDPLAASEWVGSLAKSRARDAAISGLAHTLMESDPEAGVSWFADMDYEGDLNPHLHNAMLRWLRQDEAAARAWIEAQPPDRVAPELVKKVFDGRSGSK